MKSERVFGFFKYLAVAGNVLFVLWILRNGLDEGFHATIVQAFSYTSLILLLALDTTLLLLIPKTRE